MSTKRNKKQGKVFPVYRLVNSYEFMNYRNILESIFDNNESITKECARKAIREHLEREVV